MPVGIAAAMTIALAAVSVALGVLVVVLTAMIFLRRGDRSGDERLSSAVADMNARMESMVRELNAALEHAEQESRRNRVLGDIAGSIDLDEVLARTLEAASAVPGVDASLIALAEGPDGKPLVATLGLSKEEGEREGLVAGPPDGRTVRSVALSYQYSPNEQDANGGLIRAGISLPVVSESGQLGHLAVFTRSPDRSFGESDLRELEELVTRAAPAIENARRFREARQLADLDALTGLHNRRFFHETLAREVARAQRYNRTLALIVFDLDDFKAINDRIGHLAGDGVLAEAAERVREVVRGADVACRVGGDEFAIILPESTLADADQLYRRILQNVSSRPIGNVGSLLLSAGVAELRPEDDSRSFFQRADAALYAAKDAGKGRMVAASTS